MFTFNKFVFVRNVVLSSVIVLGLASSSINIALAYTGAGHSSINSGQSTQSTTGQNQNSNPKLFGIGSGPDAVDTGADASARNLSGATPAATPAAGSNKKMNKPVPVTSSTQQKSKFSPKMLVTAPERFFMACPGAIVGAPIATTKKIIDESKQATIDLVGDNRNPVVLSVFGLFLGIPAGVLSGSTEGPVKAAANGWKYANDKPFSKEYFSLGDNGQSPGSQ